MDNLYYLLYPNYNGIPSPVTAEFVTADRTDPKRKDDRP